MLARFRAPLLFFLLGTPIAFLPLYLFRPNSHAISSLPYLIPMMYAGGFIFSFGAGIFFSVVGAMHNRFRGQRTSKLLGSVIGTFSGALASYLAFRGHFITLVPPTFWGGIAGLVCGLLYTYQCDGRFVPIWGDAAFRDREDAAATAQLSKFLRLKYDGTLDGPHGPCPSCNAFIAQDLAECPGCKASLTRPTPKA